MAGDRSDAIKAGKAFSLAVGPEIYAEVRRKKRAKYERERRARKKALRSKVDRGKTTTTRRVRVEDGKR
jgi:hypothetical protein